MLGEKPENPEKNHLSKGENQQTTLLAYDTESGNRSRVTVVRVERSHRYVTHTSQNAYPDEDMPLKQEWSFMHLGIVRYNYIIHKFWLYSEPR
jgi:hypothetical protein